MEIKRLQVLLTEQDLNDLAAKHLPQEVAVEELEITVLPEGVRVKGVYQLFVPVSFEMLWELGVHEGAATARLAKFRTMGMPANVLRSLIMNVIADAAKGEKWLQVQGDTVRLDVDELLKNELLKNEGLNIQMRLQTIQCQEGQLAVEAGEYPDPSPRKRGEGRMH